MKQISLLFIVILVISCAVAAEAGRYEFAQRLSFGVMEFEENTSAEGIDIEGDATLNTFLLGVTGEYSFARLPDFFIGADLEWAWGTEDTETWDGEGEQIQENDLRIFGQFYDLRFGYRNSHPGVYYKLYISGGWDGIHFERDNFALSGTTKRNDVTEDFRLWNVGGGLSLGVVLSKWLLDGMIEYAYYPQGEGKNSQIGDLEYDTEGNRLELRLGIGREVMENLRVFFGGSYILFDLDVDEVENRIEHADSELRIAAGFGRLTYEF